MYCDSGTEIALLHVAKCIDNVDDRLLEYFSAIFMWDCSLVAGIRQFQLL